MDRSDETIQMRRPVFVDGSGRRDRRLRFAGWTVAALGAAYAIGVAVSVALAPGSPVDALPFGAVFLPPADSADITPVPHADTAPEVSTAPTATTQPIEPTTSMVAPVVVGPAAAVASGSQLPDVAVTSQPATPSPTPTAHPSTTTAATTTNPAPSVPPSTTPVTPTPPSTTADPGDPHGNGQPGTAGAAGESS